MQSNWGNDFGHAGTGSRAKKQVGFCANFIFCCFLTWVIKRSLNIISVSRRCFFTCDILTMIPNNFTILIYFFLNSFPNSIVHSRVNFLAGQKSSYCFNIFHAMICQDFCYDHLTSQFLPAFILIIRALSVELCAWHFALLFCVSSLQVTFNNFKVIKEKLPNGGPVKVGLYRRGKSNLSLSEQFCLV